MKAGTAPKDPKAAIQQAEKISNIRGIRNAFLVILACAAVAVCIFLFVMGADSNFEEGHPKNLLGTVYKGGFIVPILMTLLLTVIVISIERAIAISSASGKGHTTKFVADIKLLLAKNDIKGAMQRCRQQRGHHQNDLHFGTEQISHMVSSITSGTVRQRVSYSRHTGSPITL